MLKTVISCLASILMIGCTTDAKKENQVIIEEKVFFKNIQDGDILTSPILVQMGAQGIKVEAADVSRVGYGHHHILLNRESWIVNQIITQSDTTFHFPNGETEGTISLRPGNHKLTLQFGDGIHQSLGKQLSSTINITVVQNE